jgi:ABC-type transporter MlaC component
MKSTIAYEVLIAMQVALQHAARQDLAPDVMQRRAQRALRLLAEDTAQRSAEVEREIGRPS